MKKLYKILLVVIAGVSIAGFANAYLSQYWKTISDIIPRTDNNVDIGTDAKRVKKIWTHDLSASSTITSATSTATTLTDGTLSITGGDLTTTGTIDAGNMAFEKVGTLISQKNPAYNEDFVIGSPQLADTGTSLHDTRMWYDKSKGAFRAGKASGDQWDDANVGNYSSAFGFNTKATTWGAVAFGAYTQALGLYSVSFGYASEALGKYAVSFGQSTLADCYADVVFGRYNVGGGNADAWVATDPILEVGIGTANDARANALTIYKDGNMEVAGSITTPSTVTASSYITGAFTLTVDETESLSSYLTSARAGTWLATKDTGDLTEGTNLYYTDARVKTHADTLYLPIIADANVDLGVYDFTTTGTGTFGSTTDGIVLNDGTTAAHVYGSAATEYLEVDTGINLNFVGPPIEPTLELIAEAGNVDNGEHHYFVTAYTALGETSAHADSGAPSVTTDAGHGKVTVTIPVIDDYRVVGRRIYRTKAGASYYKCYLCADVANNVDTEYIDNIADASLTGFEKYGFDKPDTTNSVFLADGVPAAVLSDKGTVFGYGAKAGLQGVAVGQNAGKSLTFGSLNTLIGQGTGGQITTGGSNVFVGDNAGGYTTGGTTNNVGIGRNALYKTSYYSVGVGINAGIYTTGGYNTFVGTNAGRGATSGTVNHEKGVAIGMQAGLVLTTGDNNILIGYQAGNSLTTGASNIIIGYGADAPAVDTSNYLNIGGAITGNLTTGDITFANDLTATGTIQGGGYKSSDGTAGATATVTVRNQAGDGTCDLVFKNGLFISTTCP